MPAAVAQYTMVQLRNLELDPALLSTRSHFPFRAKCQIFSFDLDHQGQRFFINALFQYHANEEELLISDIPWQAASDWWEPDAE